MYKYTYSWRCPGNGDRCLRSWAAALCRAKSGSGWLPRKPGCWRPRIWRSSRIWFFNPSDDAAIMWLNVISGRDERMWCLECSGVRTVSILGGVRDSFSSVVWMGESSFGISITGDFLGSIVIADGRCSALTRFKDKGSSLVSVCSTLMGDPPVVTSSFLTSPGSNDVTPSVAPAPSACTWPSSFAVWFSVSDVSFSSRSSSTISVFESSSFSMVVSGRACDSCSLSLPDVADSDPVSFELLLVLPCCWKRSLFLHLALRFWNQTWKREINSRIIHHNFSWSNLWLDY